MQTDSKCMLRLYIISFYYEIVLWRSKLTYSRRANYLRLSSHSLCIETRRWNRPVSRSDVKENVQHVVYKKMDTTFSRMVFVCLIVKAVITTIRFTGNGQKCLNC